MTKAEEVLEELECLDKLIWWIDFGQYANCKELIIPKLKEVTAEDLIND